MSEAYLLVFGGLLLVGLIGELVADQGPKGRLLSKKQMRCLEEFENPPSASSRNGWFKKQKWHFAILVIVGVSGEFFSDGGLWFFSRELQVASDNENSVLQTQAAANSLAAKQLEIQLAQTKTQLANAEARLNESVTDLENANLPMDIGEQVSFANGLRSLPPIQVELRSAIDSKSQQTAESLFTVFFMAGWPVINRALIGDIGEEGIIIGCNVDAVSEQAAHLLLKLLTDRDVPSKLIEDPTGRQVRVPTNAIIVAVCPRPGQLRSQSMVLNAKAIGVTDKIPELDKRVRELINKRNSRPTKTFTDAEVAEGNNLQSQFLKLEDERSAFWEQARKLEEQIQKKESKTNSGMPGQHQFMYGGRIRINAPPELQ
jgi:hypothetical protein